MGLSLLDLLFGRAEEVEYRSLFGRDHPFSLVSSEVEEENTIPFVQIWRLFSLFDLCYFHGYSKVTIVCSPEPTTRCGVV